MPASFRWAVTIAVIVGFQVGLSAVFDAHEALNADNPTLGGEESQLASTGLSPELQRQVWLARRTGYQTAIAAMVPWRVGTEVLMALAGGAVFVLALRLRVLTEERAEAAALLGRAAVIAAVLRTVEGAQGLVIVRTVATQTGEVLTHGGTPDGPIAASALMGMMTLASILWSLAVVGAFMGLGTYFRSERTRDALRRLEP